VQRILQPGEIEPFAQRAVPRIRLPDRGNLFSRRARRLRELSANHTIGDYLRLLASGLELTGVPVDTQIVVVAVRFRREVDYPAPSGGDYFNEERMATEIREACLARGVESLEGVGA
jgi:hypothetical protein